MTTLAWRVQFAKRKIVNTLLYFDKMKMTKLKIFIEQFRARWPWSIGVLES